MIIIKSLILLLILGGSTSIGFLVSKKYEYRVCELKEFKNAMNMLETKIKFTYEPLNDIFKEISGNLQEKISIIFSKTSEYMKQTNTKDAWNISIEEEKENLSFNKEDFNIIKNLGNMLGKTDVEGQVSEIELTSNFLDMQITKAEDERRKNEKLYRNLGTIVGLAIVIILI